MPDRTVFAVASAKGGVGKTTTSINLGTALAGLGLDVVVVELDLAMANVVDFLSLDFDEDADPSMHEVLAGDVPVTDALYEAPGGAMVAPSGTSLDALGSVDMNLLSDAVEVLAARFDAVLLDTGAGVNSATTTAVQAADETILVSTPRVASIRDTEKTRTIVEQRGGEVGGLVLTQAGTGSSPGSQRLTEFLGVDLLCTVPQDPSIPESQDAGVPVVERCPDTDVAGAYVDGAATLFDSRNRESETEASTADEPETGDSETDEARAESSGTSEPGTDGPETVEAGVDDPENDEAAIGPSTTGSDAPSPPQPSRETLEAQGWTFPGAIDREAPDGSEDPGIDIVEHRVRDRGLRPLSADGGEASVPDEAYGRASSRDVETPSPPDQLPEELRSESERDEGDQTDGEATDDPPDDEVESDGSLARRVSSFLRRSE